jgi:hypothetical protein
VIRARVARVVVAAVAAITVAGCQSFADAQTHRRLERMRAEALRDIDQPACVARGGHVSGFGMFGLPTCIVPFADAGKACTDAADCDGNCVRYDDFAQAGTRVGGTCQVESPEDGCFQFVEAGLAQMALCAD